ncbi:MRPL22 mitochondrial ribosomal large subunit [Apiospora rasikravindrae]|uniref:MRPL22 mitochondrial ribosomal large subunit n=1 Tax=Apiospora rasikravindrae TaxID=990691 RepID=A0ABR1TEZ0_9PEZI
MSLPLPARRLVQTAIGVLTTHSTNDSPVCSNVEPFAPSPLPPTIHPKTPCLVESLQLGQELEAQAGPALRRDPTPRERTEALQAHVGAHRWRLHLRGGDPGIREAHRRRGGATKAGMAGYELSDVREHKMRALDPDPRWRVRWQRRQVMQMVRGGKKLTKEQKIKLAEKDLTYQSENMETSTKKLVHLARQIAGKPIDEAITQMRYTKKKTGKMLVYYLEEARDRAIVARGMGLGKANGQTFAEPKQIQTKDGKWMEVSDPTQLYVDQAWVGKGPWRGYRIQYHARGRSSGMWHPSTHINFVLKEEKTRIRQHQERVDKQAKAKPWVHLPNRPVTSQRQHYSW